LLSLAQIPPLKIRLPLNIRVFFPALLFVLGNNAVLFSQKQNVDSLIHVLSASSSDTVRAKALLSLATHYYNTSDYSRSMHCAREALELAERSGKKYYIASACGKIGINYHRAGNNVKAIEYRKRELELARGLNDKKAMAVAYNGLGIIEHEMGNFPEALGYYLKALQLQEETGNRDGMAYSYNNIALIYDFMGKQEEAIDNLQLALKTNMELGNQKGIAGAHGNLANIYSYNRRYAEALEHFNEALRIQTEMKDKSELAITYSNLGLFYDYQEKFDYAIQNYSIALQYQLETGDKRSLAISYNNMGSMFGSVGRLNDATEFLERGLKLSLEMNNKEWIAESYGNLALLDSVRGDLESSFKHLKLQSMWLDSMVNEENTRKAVGVEMSYAFEKKENEDRILQEKKEALSAEENRKNSILLAGIITLVMLLGGFSFTIYRNDKKKKLANQELREQKRIVEEHQKEILDSIHYARRIQGAMLPGDKQMERMLARCKNILLLVIMCVHMKGNRKIDSLLAALKNVQNDTTLVNAFNSLSWQYMQQGDYEKARQYAEQSLQKVSVAGYQNTGESLMRRRLEKQRSVALCNLGMISDMQGNFPGALKYCAAAIKIAGDFNDKRQIAVCLDYIANAYSGLGNYQSALDCYELGLKFCDTADHFIYTGYLDNIGVTFNLAGKPDSALRYFQKAFGIYNSEKNMKGMIAEGVNVGAAYASLKKFEQAEKFIGRALNICSSIHENTLTVFVYGSMGMMYEDWGRDASALKYLALCKDKAKQNGLMNELSMASLHSGRLLMKNNRMKESEMELQQALKIYRESGDWQGMLEAHEALYQNYGKQKHWKDAIVHFTAYRQVRDSVHSQEFARNSERSMMSLEFGKKQTEQRMLAGKKNEVDAARSRRLRMAILFLCGFLIITAVFLIYVCRSYLNRKKINVAITEQKQRVEEKQKEIMDSIYYARRIQISLMTSEKYIARRLSRQRSE
jgi:tetratricopeptide (TPR) repeat protein